jgi:hypothetical protein
MMNKETEERIKALEEGLVGMFSSNKFKMDIRRTKNGTYEFIRDGEVVSLDEDFEFRLRIFLNAYNVLSEHEGGEE